MGYIIRIDKPKNSVKGTHGWQVRVHTGVPKKYHSKLFSDQKCGSKGKALVAAEEYLAQYLKEHPEAPKMPVHVPYHRGRLSIRNKSGVTGVCRTHDFNRRQGTGVLLGRVCAHWPQQKKVLEEVLYQHPWGGSSQTVSRRFSEDVGRGCELRGRRVEGVL